MKNLKIKFTKFTKSDLEYMFLVLLEERNWVGFNIDDSNDKYNDKKYSPIDRLVNVLMDGDNVIMTDYYSDDYDEMEFNLDTLNEKFKKFIEVSPKDVVDILSNEDDMTTWSNFFQVVMYDEIKYMI